MSLHAHPLDAIWLVFLIKLWLTYYSTQCLIGWSTFIWKGWQEEIITSMAVFEEKEVSFYVMIDAFP